MDRTRRRLHLQEKLRVLVEVAAVAQPVAFLRTVGHAVAVAMEEAEACHEGPQQLVKVEAPRKDSHTIILPTAHRQRLAPWYVLSMHLYVAL